MKRRNLIKSLSLLPFTAALPSQLFGKSTSVTNVVENGENIFRSLGVEPLINCRGTFTIIGDLLKGLKYALPWKPQRIILCNMMS
jgi:D-glucosaminate-6-phosphate ammonia-lyase